MSAQPKPSPTFPSTLAELERVAVDRETRWHLLDELEALEQRRPLTPDELEVGNVLCTWLVDEAGELQAAIGRLLCLAARQPDPATWALVTGAWASLSPSDAAYLEEQITGSESYVHSFRAEHGEESRRVQLLRWYQKGGGLVGLPRLLSALG